MAGKVGARQFTEADKAAALVTLAANGGMIKRAARDTGIAPATLRRWRDQQQRAATGGGPPAASPQALTKAKGTFAEEATEVRDLALASLKTLITANALTGSALVATVGMLDDKLTRAAALPTSHVMHTHVLPSPDELRTLMGGVVAAAIEQAETRELEIEDADVVEVTASPLAISAG